MSDSDDEQARLQAAYAEMAARHGAGYHASEQPAVQWFERHKRDSIVRALVRSNRPVLKGLPVLEIGCGSGGILPYLAELGADPDQLYGVDLQPDRIATAQARHPQMHFQVIDAAGLPFADASFDIVAAFTVISSILAPERRWAVASEIRRVLRPGGIVLWYDMRWPNPANAHIRPVSRAELKLLFPDCQIDVAPHTLMPPLARRLAPRWPQLADRLARSPLLCSHLTGVLKKAAPPADGGPIEAPASGA